MSSQVKKVKKFNRPGTLRAAMRIWKPFLCLLLVMITLLLMLNLQPNPAAADSSGFASGSGTSEDPWLIETPDQLNNVRNYLGSGHSNKHFKLAGNIDLNAAPYNAGSGWEPIGTESDRFYGKFDGDGKTISNLFINRPDQNNVGLFGYTGYGFSIENVNLESVNITGQNYVGSLIGFSGYGNLSGCSAAGTVDGSAFIDGSGNALINNIGGLVGAKYGKITDCTVNVDVTAIIASDVAGQADIRYVGGLAGSTQDDMIENCTTSGDPQVEVKITAAVTGDARINNIGGLVGLIYYGRLLNCSSGSIVTAEIDIPASKTVNNAQIYMIGGLIGENEGSYPESGINGSSADGSVKAVIRGEVLSLARIYRIGGLIGLITNSPVSSATASATVTAEMKDLLCNNAVIDDIGGLVGLNLYESPITDSTASGAVDVIFQQSETLSNLSIINIGGLAGRNYGITALQNSLETSSSNSAVTVSVIGGSGTTITGNLAISRIAGLVGYNEKSYINSSSSAGSVSVLVDKVVLVGENVNMNSVGGLVGGNNLNNNIEHSSATGPVSINCSATITGFNNHIYAIGGLVGHTFNNTSIDTCFAEGAVISQFTGTAGIVSIYAVGGLVGDCYEDALFNNCYATGNVAINGTANSTKSRVGGLIGVNRGTIQACFASGDASTGGSIHTSDAMVGGLAGDNQGIIENSFASGAVSGYDHVGGLVGYNYNELSNCYAVGKVDGSSYTGGLVGYNHTEDPYYSAVSDSYYDTETTEQFDDAGKGVPKSTIEMKAGTPSDDIYKDWSTTIWSFPVDKYPQLINLVPPAPPAAPNLLSPVHGAFVEGTTVELEWEAPAGATHYNVWVFNLSTDQLLYYELVAGETTFTVEGLPDNGDYTAWSVTAGDAGSGLWGDFAVPRIFQSGTDKAMPPPTLISPADGNNISGTTADFAWDAPEGALAYHIAIINDTTGELLHFNERLFLGHEKEFTFEGLPDNGDTILWTVVAAIDIGVWSDFAFPRTFVNE